MHVQLLIRKKKKKGTIAFDRVIDVDRPGEAKKFRNRFVIKVKKSKRVFDFKAATEDECSTWIRALRDKADLGKASTYQSEKKKKKRKTRSKRNVHEEME